MVCHHKETQLMYHITTLLIFQVSGNTETEVTIYFSTLQPTKSCKNSYKTPMLQLTWSSSQCQLKQVLRIQCNWSCLRFCLSSCWSLISHQSTTQSSIWWRKRNPELKKLWEWWVWPKQLIGCHGLCTTQWLTPPFLPFHGSFFWSTSSIIRMRSMFGYSSGFMDKQFSARSCSFNRYSQARNTLESSQLSSTLEVISLTSWLMAKINHALTRYLLRFYHRCLSDKVPLYSRIMSALVLESIIPLQPFYTVTTLSTPLCGCSSFLSSFSAWLACISTIPFQWSLEGVNIHAIA